MTISKQRVLDYVEFEWGTYVERFHRLPKVEQDQRVKATGYDSLRDLLAHILAWWEEGLGVILAIAEERPFERKKYDFDLFNAEAVAKYKDWDESEFMAHFEKVRQKMASDLKPMNETVFENRRVRTWLRGVILEHAREHLVTLSRFLAIDMLKNNWATYIEDFKRLEPELQKEFLSKQGFDSFHDLLAHIIGWWEEGARTTTGILDSPAFTWQTPETDPFNLELIRKFSAWSDDDLLKHYECVRLALMDLIERLPEDAFRNKDIESWLAEDIVEHYDEHPIPQR
ncbi:MAG TPA: ClbS/DfsB family four-helix bundle protein [Anaerolineales bacterium]|nr:ClbS/DfsB family four-helix bundle protein [Anaerolineales bacterium]HLO29438.1 ClbS/DfsB family four-helix bundle protein [Anaerolineales bacterium]